MPGTTARLALPYPLSSESPAGHTQIQNLANALDGASIDLAEGTLAARPVPSIRGRWYYATDVATLYRDSGSTWRAVVGNDVITSAMIASDAVGNSELAPDAVTNTEVAAGAAIAEAKLALASDAAAGTASRRTLGTGATQAAAGNDVRFPAGADIVDADISAVALPYAAYRTLLEGGGSVFGAEGGMTAGVYVVSRTGGPVVSSGADPGPIVLAAYLDDADFPSLGGKSPRLRLRGQLYTNSIAPGTTITFGLYPISSVAGSGSNNSTTLGAVVAGSTVAFAAPGANSLNQGASSEFAMPADGHYALGVALAGTIATNARAILSLQLQLHWV